MARSRLAELYSLYLLLATIASAHPGPEPSPAPYLGGFQLNIPEPTTAPSKPKKYGFYARDDSSYAIASSSDDYYDYSSASDAGIDTMSEPTTSIQAVSTSTSLAPVSACGYIDGVWDDSYSLVYCGDSNQCLFHTSDSSYPGMVGCCSGNDPNNCAYETTCYDVDDLASTPSLASSYDIFGVYCTDTASGVGACQTMVYPDLSITGYGCGETADVISIYTEATYDPTTNIADWESYPTVAYVSASIVDDKWIDIYVSGTAATATTEMAGMAGQAVTSTPDSSSKTAQPNASAAGGGSDSSKKNSTNTGAIAGGVVGGVVGAAGIGAAAFMWCLLKKRKQKDAAAAGEAAPALGDTREVQTSVIMPPQEIEGSAAATANTSTTHEVEGTTYQHYAEVDGYGASKKFPSAMGAAAAGSTDTKPQEMDSKNFVAELPAHSPRLDEERPLSSDTSRPATPDSSRRS